MPKLPRLTGRELAKLILKFGFIHLHTAGSHMVFRHADGRMVVVPCHSGEEIGPGLLTKIIKDDLKITRQEFLDMLLPNRKQ